jgi:hypothetical protein
MSEETQRTPISDDDLVMALRVHSFTCRPGAGNAFFNGFEYVQDLYQGNYAACLNKGILLMSKCVELDALAYERIHKGSAYYWMGMAAFLSNDFQTATFFFDAAVSEDLRAGHDPVCLSTPSFKFLLVQGDPPAQAAKPLVAGLQHRIDFVLHDYNLRPGRTVANPQFSLERLRSDFIVPALSPGNEHLRSLPTALISFVLEWHYLNSFLRLRPGRGTHEPFMVHLFKGCVLFESILRMNPKAPVPSQAKGLLSVIQTVRSHLALRNDLPLAAPDFNSVVTDLAGATNSIEEGVIFTGRARNTLGHNLGWQWSMSNALYNKLVMMILCSCLHGIANLYPA